MTEVEDRGHIKRLVYGQMAGQIVATAARLGVADAIGAGEATGAQIAETIGAHDLSTTRLCRALAAIGLADEVAPGRFRLSGAGATLRTDHPDSMNPFVRMFSDPTMLSAWRELDTAVRTGAPTFDMIFGTRFFDHLATDAELSEQFNVSMRLGTTMGAQLLPQHYDFSSYRTVADIGGGDGSLLAAILDAHPDLRGILYETTEGAAQAADTLARHGVSDRCTVVTGDFFTDAPDGADLYVLKSIVHDWDDDRAATILGQIHRVASTDARLLLIEPVLPDRVDGSLPDSFYVNDLNMLVNLGGRERTRTEFDSLCARAGFTMTDSTPLPPPAPVSLIEAKRR